MSTDHYDSQEHSDDLIEKRRLRRLEMKRKRIMRQRITLAAVLVVLVLIIVLIVKGCSGDKTPEKVTQQEIVPPPVAEQEPEAAPDIKATLAAVGDIMVYDTILEDLKQPDGSYSFASDCFLAVKAYTSNATLTVGNLEANITGAPPYGGKPIWNAPESLAADLQDIGFDVMLTANTYSITNGINGLANTTKFLNAAGIDHVGTHISDPDESVGAGAILRDANGIKVAFIGFTKGVDGRSLPPNNTYAVDLLYTDYQGSYTKINSSGILDRIEDAKALNPDVIVALCHWGGEFDLEVTQSQQDIADLLLTNGVDVILGSHSHVVGPMGYVDVTTKDGESKTCFVAYSLGNFLSHMEQPYAMESVILNLEFTKSGETGKTTVTGANYTPLYILDAGADADVRFQILPIRNAISSKLFEPYESAMEEAIQHLAQHTVLDPENPVALDSGE